MYKVGSQTGLGIDVEVKETREAALHKLECNFLFRAIKYLFLMCFKQLFISWKFGRKIFISKIPPPPSHQEIKRLPLMLRLYSASAGPAFRLDPGQFYKIIPLECWACATNLDTRKSTISSLNYSCYKWGLCEYYHLLKLYPAQKECTFTELFFAHN